MMMMMMVTTMMMGAARMVTGVTSVCSWTPGSGSKGTKTAIGGQDGGIIITISMMMMVMMATIIVWKDVRAITTIPLPAATIG